MRIFLFAAIISLSLAACAEADGRSNPAASMPMLSPANTIEACLGWETDAKAVCIGQYSEACARLSPDGQTTVGMTRCTVQEYEAWDARLNTTHDALMQQLDEPRATGLQEAQRAWISLRDADCEFAASVYEGGSMQPLVRAACRLEYTAERTIRLLGWLDQPH